MKEIRVPLECFDLEGMYEQNLQFWQEEKAAEFGSTYGIIWVEGYGDVPLPTPQSAKDVLAAIRECDKQMFLAFAHAEEDGFLISADGYLSPKSEGGEDEIRLKAKDAVGFLVRVVDGYVVISPAIKAALKEASHPSSVTLCENLGSQEEPMAEYISQFMKTSSTVADTEP